MPIKKITIDQQLEIFERVFFILIETPSFREHLRAMIDSREKVDLAEVDLKLAKLSVEINEQNKGG